MLDRLADFRMVLVVFVPGPPALSLTFNPPNPSLPDNCPIGTPIATAVATWRWINIYRHPVNSDNGLCVRNGNQITLGTPPPPYDATQNCTVSPTP
jgi:hypothetical protein